MSELDVFDWERGRGGCGEFFGVISESDGTGKTVILEELPSERHEYDRNRSISSPRTSITSGDIEQYRAFWSSREGY